METGIRKWIFIFFLLSVLLVTSCDLTKTETMPSSPTPSGTNASPTITTLPGTPIAFEYYRMRGAYWRTKPEASIWVITRLENYTCPQDIEWHEEVPAVPEPPPELLNFDFSENFLIIVFNGLRGGYGTAMKTKGVWQDKSKIYILVHFDDLGTGSTSIPIISSQYDVLRLSKDDLTQGGEITFILLDNSGKERAKVICEVTK